MSDNEGRKMICLIFPFSLYFGQNDFKLSLEQKKNFEILPHSFSIVV